mmetsp:Transcript_7993/g.26634  ORF Transcript_7993/g.26634 Transcript_7993/m.26634 type:complete len:243 (-) Transcript_7993:107-835(-)
MTTSSCTHAMGLSWNISSCVLWKVVYFFSWSGGYSLPRGSHSIWLVRTSLFTTLVLSALSRTQRTLRRMTMVLFSLAVASSVLNEKSRGSARMGIIPRRWARTSSWMMEVLLAMKTFSIAMVGTSAIRMRRKALAMAASMPTMSNTIDSSSSALTSILKSVLNFSRLRELSLSSVMYAPLYWCPDALFTKSLLQVARVFWRCSSSGSPMGTSSMSIGDTCLPFLFFLSFLSDLPILANVLQM